jgi:hypothetical protein
VTERPSSGRHRGVHLARSGQVDLGDRLLRGRVGQWYGLAIGSGSPPVDELEPSVCRHRPLLVCSARLLA